MNESKLKIKGNSLINGLCKEIIEKQVICNNLKNLSPDTHTNREYMKEACIYVLGNKDKFLRKKDNVFYFERNTEDLKYKDINKYLYLYNCGGFGIIIRGPFGYCVKLVLRKGNTAMEHEYTIPQQIRTVFYEKGLEEYTRFLLIPDVLIKNCKFPSFSSHIYVYSFITVLSALVLGYKPNLRLYSLDKILCSPDVVSNIFSEYSAKKNFNIIYSNIYHKFFKSFTKIIFFTNFNKLLNIVSKFEQKFLKTPNDVNEVELLIQSMGITTPDLLTLKDINTIGTSIDKKAYIVNKYFLRYLVLHVFLFVLVSNRAFDFFLHNDLKLDNILVFNNDRTDSFVYKSERFNAVISLNELYTFKIIDFDFSTLSYDGNIHINKRVENAFTNKHWYTDVHYFIRTLTNYFPEYIFKNTDPDFYKFLNDNFIRTCTSNKIKRCNCTVDLKLIFLEEKIFNNGFFDTWLKKV